MNRYYALNRYNEVRDIHAILRTFLRKANFRQEEPGKPQLVCEDRMRLE